MLAFSLFICITKNPQAQAASAVAPRSDRSTDCGGKGSRRSLERTAQPCSGQRAKAADFGAQIPAMNNFRPVRVQG
jgi:hypothetical protein